VAFPSFASASRLVARVQPLPFDPSTVQDPNAWQPLRYVDATGAVVTPAFIAPHWNRVAPFALPSDAALRSPTGPAKFGSAQYVEQARALLDLSAGLTDEQKVIAEYWADGPHSELPPGHWNLFVQFVSRRDRQSRTSTASISTSSSSSC
jgi:hypothetical protein